VSKTEAIFLNINSPVALVIKAICGIHYKPVDLKLILLFIHWLMKKQINKKNKK